MSRLVYFALPLGFIFYGNTNSLAVNTNSSIVYFASAVEAGGGRSQNEQKLWEEREKFVKDIQETYAEIEKIKRQNPLPTFIKTIATISDIQKHLGTNESMSAELLTIYDNSIKVDRLDKQLGSYTQATSYELRYKSQLKILNKQKAMLQGRANQINKENAEIKKRSSRLEWLNNELLLEEAKESSLDDELLGMSSSSDSSSILDESNEELDFLSKTSGVNDKDYSIEYKDGKYGVINIKTKKVLIPFRRWDIQSYDDGIAEVRLHLKSETVCKVRNGSYSFKIYKKGYVDNTGEFLDEPEIVADGSFGGGAMLVLSVGNYDKEESERKARLSEQRCINKGKKRMQEVYSQY